MQKRIRGIIIFIFFSEISWIQYFKAFHFVNTVKLERFALFLTA